MDKNEQVVEETTKKEQPKVDNEVDKLKVKTKPKMKKFKQEDEVIKVDLSKTQKPEEKIEERIDAIEKWNKERKPGVKAKELPKRVFRTSRCKF